MPLSEKKVLIIEDDSTLRAVYEEILHQNDYIVRTASDGLVGLKEMHTFKPNVVLLDILMPNLNGLQFLERVNLDRDFPDTKVVVFSNLSDVAMLQEMLELGAQQHILKSSMSPRELLLMVENALDDRICPN